MGRGGMITVMESSVLRFVRERELVTIKELTGTFHVKQDCMERMLKKLRYQVNDNGYIEKRKKWHNPQLN